MSKLGKYRFTKMPFGLRNAPATFQRLMDHVLAGMQEHAAAYMDDIVIHSDTWEHHVQHLRALMTTLKQHGLTVKNKKCQISMTTCKYLGHVVGNGTTSPQQCKIESIETFKTPRIKKGVRAFLGLAGYYRRFLLNFSTIAAPLSDLTMNIAPNRVEWTDKCERAFQTLKQALAAQPILATPDYSKEFIVQTDASEQGIGAVLSQQDDDRGDRPLAFFSWKLLDRERNYSTVEKECLAIVAALKHFEVYLLGRTFVVQTDHRALKYLNSMRSTNSRLTRWALTLQDYNFRVKYRPGESKGNADALSRQAWEGLKTDGSFNPFRREEC